MIEAGIRDRVRGFIEELLEQELTAALGGRSKHERAVEHHQGYRNGTRERQLTGSFGAVPLSVPRARLADKNGDTSCPAMPAEPGRWQTLAELPTVAVPLDLAA